MSQDNQKSDAAARPPAGTPESPERSEIEPLREALEAKAQEASKNYDLYLRERAEVDNFKKGMMREKADALRFACEPLIRDLLPIVDNLERAIEHGEQGHSVVEGVGMVLKSLLDILERHGVKRIEAVGQPFDPARHEAMAQVVSPEHEPNRVIQQHHRGYLLHDRLLRPALVTVSGRKSAPAVETESDSD